MFFAMNEKGVNKVSLTKIWDAIIAQNFFASTRKEKMCLLFVVKKDRQIQLKTPVTLISLTSSLETG
jgi:hypothetical protein